jgi:hypothetical protein
MICKIRVVIIGDDGREETREVACLERTDLKPETLGLTLAEGKMILKELQQIVVERQVSGSLLLKQTCPDCGEPRCTKGSHTLLVRTVFGQLTVRSPRLHHCACRPHETKTFSPLAELLPNHSLPELLFLETKWASLMSYGMTSKLLQEVLPIDEPLDTFTIRRHVADVAERLERELGEEQFCFIEGCQQDWDQLPPPDGPLTVGIDGGFIRAPRKEGHFEVIAGKSMLTFRRDEDEDQPSASPSYRLSTRNPNAAFLNCSNTRACRGTNRSCFFPMAARTCAILQLYLNPQAEHLLDWFHVTMRLTVLIQTAKGLSETIGKGEEQEPLRSEVLKTLESIKWYLRHGNVFQALRHLGFAEMDLEGAAFEIQEEITRKLLKAVEEFSTYIQRNCGFTPNYGERYRNGERISTGFVESAVKQVVSKRMAKKQQMQWTQREAHLLLQVRTRVLNGEWEDVFRRWYPDFRQQRSLSAAA